MGKKSAGKESGICPVGRQYDTLNDIAKAFGLNTGSLRVRVAGGKELAATVSEMLEKETILFRGREYAGISSLAVAYGHDGALINERLIYGMTLERALSQPIRQVNRPEFAIEYDGKMYAAAVFVVGGVMRWFFEGKKGWLDGYENIYLNKLLG